MAAGSAANITSTGTIAKNTSSTTAKVVGTASSTVSGLTSAQINDGCTRAQNFYNINHRLPNYVSYGTRKVLIADFEKILTTQGLSINLIYSRPVYITSDNINGTAKDNARINKIITELNLLGIKAYNMGLGPNKHIKVLQSTTVPQNALVVDIFGGADAGTIYEMGQSWYKSIRGARKVFSIFLPPSKVITGLSFLQRAHDDDYDPVSFTGLANPDKYMINNGYKYLYSGDISTIVNSMFIQANN